ncbi:MAG: amidohydrolase family protein [Phycisphaerae bacterium]|nr:amidohydrolase family protein [Phycisphaerae bacterium]MDW8261837.1 amidohydrolase family protein [Phycisphaerales bacterium]
MNDRPILLRAAAVAPMDRPLIRDGGVFCASGRIISVGPVEEVRRSLPPHQELDLGHCLLLPGLINAHTHLELSDCNAADSVGLPFCEWIQSLPRRTGRQEADFPRRVEQAVENGIRQCLRFGVTAVADITAHPHLTRPRLRLGPLRVVSFGEALGLGGARERFEQSLRSACDPSLTSEHLRIGLSPHAPYTVDYAGYAECVAIARRAGTPLATHLSETREEAVFLRQRDGPFRHLWEKLGICIDGGETFQGSPVAYARAVGLLDLPAILAHVNYCDDDDLALLASGQASVVVCPRTHAYFRHEPHRWREMLRRGVNVAVGTDSCASSPDLNLVDDLRLLWKLNGRDIETEVLWSLATIRAARALQLEGRAGSITPGKLADLVAFAFVGEVDPLAAVLEDPSALPVAVWIGGKPVLQGPQALGT